MALSIKVIIFASLAVLGMCQQNLEPFAREDPDLPAHYAFRYEISNPTDGDVKSHSESRDGDEVSGEYSVVQPDGCIRHVRYHAGKTGYVPEVRYEGNCDPRFYLAPRAAPDNAQANEMPNQDANGAFVNFNVPVTAVSSADLRMQNNDPQMISYTLQLDPPAPAFRR